MAIRKYIIKGGKGVITSGGGSSTAQLELIYNDFNDQIVTADTILQNGVTSNETRLNQHTVQTITTQSFSHNEAPAINDQVYRIAYEGAGDHNFSFGSVQLTNNVAKEVKIENVMTNKAINFSTIITGATVIPPPGKTATMTGFGGVVTATIIRISLTIVQIYLSGDLDETGGAVTPVSNGVTQVPNGIDYAVANVDTFHTFQVDDQTTNIAINLDALDVDDGQAKEINFSFNTTIQRSFTFTTSGNEIFNSDSGILVNSFLINLIGGRRIKVLVTKEGTDKRFSIDPIFVSETQIANETAFTPTVIDAGGGATYTTGLAVGSYVKTGAIVFFKLVVSNINTVGTPIGNLRISGLPFTSSTRVSPVSVGIYRNIGVSVVSLNARVPSSVNYVDFNLKTASSQTNETALFAVTLTSGSFEVGGFYLTNE